MGELEKKYDIFTFAIYRKGQIWRYGDGKNF